MLDRPTAAEVEIADLGTALELLGLSETLVREVDFDTLVLTVDLPADFWPTAAEGFTVGVADFAVASAELEADLAPSLARVRTQENQANISNETLTRCRGTLAMSRCLVLFALVHKPVIKLASRVPLDDFGRFHILPVLHDLGDSASIALLLVELHQGIGHSSESIFDAPGTAASVNTKAVRCDVHGAARETPARFTMDSHRHGRALGSVKQLLLLSSKLLFT